MKVIDMNVVITFSRTYEELFADLSRMRPGEQTVYTMRVTQDKRQDVALERIERIARESRT
jgi:hypothetical protein